MATADKQLFVTNLQHAKNAKNGIEKHFFNTLARFQKYE